MKRAVTLLLVAALVAGGAVYLFKDRVATAIFTKTVETIVSRDSRDELPDGLHAAFCGTGTPFPDLDRAGGCLAVIAGKRLFVFDAGDGAAETLMLMGLTPGNAEALFLTHFHSDHIDGMGSMLMQRILKGTLTERFPVYGAPGVEEVTEGFSMAYRQDHNYRLSHHGPRLAKQTGIFMGDLQRAYEFESNTIEMGASDRAVVLDDGEVKITAFKVNHHPVEPALGYRVEYKDYSLVITGDIGNDPMIADMAKEADLLISEALSPKMVKIIEGLAIKHENFGLERVMRDIPEYHISPEQAAKRAAEAGVKALAFTHMIPQLPTPLLYPVFLEDAPKHFSGDIWVTEDGDLISLHGDGEITRQNLLP